MALRDVGGDLDAGSCPNLSSLPLLEVVGGELNMSHTGLRSLGKIHAARFCVYGALVPESELAQRRRDGSVIHRLRGDGLVPDLLRVDERAGIYVAEESGYLAAYGVAARLAVVK